MSVPYQGSMRIGIRQYWMMVAGSFVVSVVAIAVAIFAVFSAQFMPVFIAVLTIFASGLYLRIAEIRRCRDIGWPPALPWAFFGVLILLSFVSFQGGLISLTSSGLSIMLSLGDLGFAILIGCMPTKEWRSAETSDPSNYGADDGYAASNDDRDDLGSQYDGAVAQALAAYNQGAETAHQAAAPETPPARPPARISGFGRKGTSGQVA